MTFYGTKNIRFYIKADILLFIISLLYLFILKPTMMEMIIVSTPPKMYARVRFSIPNIMGDMKMYDEQM